MKWALNNGNNLFPYMILEREGTSDREDLKKILDSFEVISQK